MKKLIWNFKKINLKLKKLILFEKQIKVRLTNSSSDCRGIKTLMIWIDFESELCFVFPENWQKVKLVYFFTFSYQFKMIFLSILKYYLINSKILSFSIHICLFNMYMYLTFENVPLGSFSKCWSFSINLCASSMLLNLKIMV